MSAAGAAPRRDRPGRREIIKKKIRKATCVCVAPSNPLHQPPQSHTTRRRGCWPAPFRPCACVRVGGTRSRSSRSRRPRHATCQAAHLHIYSFSPFFLLLKLRRRNFLTETNYDVALSIGAFLLNPWADFFFSCLGQQNHVLTCLPIYSRHR